MCLRKIAAVVIGLFLVSCEDIFEPDISGEEISLIFPVQGAQIKQTPVVFKWEEVKGSNSYRVQIASSSFQRMDLVYLDTVATRPTISIALQPGEYEWRVQALNGGYATGFKTGSFMVDASSNLSDKEVKLLSPATGSFTNNLRVQFKWEPVALAEKYIVEMLEGLPFDTVVYTTQFQKSFPRTNSAYRWRVRALNATGLAVSPVYSFTTDFEAPTVSSFLFPRVDTLITTWPVSLRWRHGSTDVVSDSLYLFGANQNTLVPGFPVKASSTSFPLTTNLSLQPGDYYWSVKSFDRAGNAGAMTEKRRFLVR